MRCKTQRDGSMEYLNYVVGNTPFLALSLFVLLVLQSHPLQGCPHHPIRGSRRAEELTCCGCHCVVVMLGLIIFVGPLSF